MTRFLYTRSAVVWLTLLIISACGFHLKGQYHYAFKRLYIASSARTSQSITARLKQLIQTAEVAVVDDLETADAILTLDVTRRRSSKSLSAQGATKEYALQIEVDYRLKGVNGIVLLEPDRLTLYRSITYNDQYALAKALESEQIYRDIENDAIDQLLRRLASVQNVGAH